MSGGARIRWTRVALEDLAAARAHLEKEQPSAWPALALRVQNALAKIRRHPLAGRLVPEQPARGFREMIVAPDRLVYAIAGRELHVLRFWRARRD